MCIHTHLHGPDVYGVTDREFRKTGKSLPKKTMSGGYDDEFRHGATNLGDAR